jgi:hypothetical protein
MQCTFSVLFYPKGSNVDKNGMIPIYSRITVDGKRSEFSIRRKVLPNKWNSLAGKMRGTTADVRELNRYMNSIKVKIDKIQETLSENKKLITAEIIRNIYLGKAIKRRMLLEIFEEHNTKVEKLIGREFAAGTAERYKTAKKHVSNYIVKEYNVEDIPVKEVDYKFITGLEYYLKTTRNCSHNTTIKYITNFKKIIRIAYANDWINKDPFLHWKAKLKIVDREYLTENEIQRIIKKEFSTNRLNQVKDIFIFCCFTGLAYADVKKLTTNDIVIGIDGDQWIKTKRAKTDTRSNIPILLIPQTIIEKYSAYNKTSEKKFILPVLSIQKMNS